MPEFWKLVSEHGFGLVFGVAILFAVWKLLITKILPTFESLAKDANSRLDKALETFNTIQEKERIMHREGFKEITQAMKESSESIVLRMDKLADKIDKRG